MSEPSSTTTSTFTISHRSNSRAGSNGSPPSPALSNNTPSRSQPSVSLPITQDMPYQPHVFHKPPNVEQQNDENPELDPPPYDSLYE